MANDRHQQFVTKYFQYGHLPDHLQGTSRMFHEVAVQLLDMYAYDDAELMVAFRKLLEAKDCAVRAALP